MPYIGNKYEIGDHNNSWKPLDDISSYVATFDGSATNAVSTSNNTIRVPEHRFIQGQRVIYSSGGGDPIGGISIGTAYYIIHHTNNEFKLATSLANANNSTAINLSALGTGTSHTLTAAFDGINKKFKITYSSGKSSRFTSATQLSISINNIVQRPNDTTTFTDGFRISDNEKIEFNVAPVASDIFWGSILSASLPTFDISDNNVDNFTGDGSTTDFTLSNIPANSQSIIVTVNGVVQHPTDKNGTRAYSLDASVLVFTAAPANGDEIQVRHIGFAGATSSSVTGFYGRTGNVTLSSSADNAIVGVITATKFSGPFVGTITGGNDIIAGIITATKIDLNGDIDVDGHTDLDNVSVAGVTTFSDAVTIADTKKLKIGNDGDVEFYFDGSSVSRIDSIGTGRDLEIRSDRLLKIAKKGNGAVGFQMLAGDEVGLYHAGNKKINTTSSGVSITGNSVVSGNVTAVDGTFSGNVSIGGTLTYEDVTNVDAVGVITARNGIIDNTLTAGRVVYVDSDKSLTDSSNLTYNGTTLMNAGGTITAERGAIPSVESKNSTSSSYARFYCSQTTGSGGYAAFQKLGTTSTAIGGANATQIWCTGDAPLVIGVNNGERLRITSDGKINTKGSASSVTAGCQSGGIHLVHANAEGTPTFTGGEVAIFQRNYNSSQGCQISIVSGTASKSIINFGDKDDVNIGMIQYENNNNALVFTTNTAERLRITSGGKVGIGSDNPNRIMTIVDSPGGGIGVIGTNAGIYMGTHHTGGFQVNAAVARAASNNYHITNSVAGDLCIAAESTKNMLFGTGPSAGAMHQRFKIKANGQSYFTGSLGVNYDVPSHNLHVHGTGNTGGARFNIDHTTTTVSGNTASGAFPHNILVSNYNNSQPNNMATIGFDIPATTGNGNHANAVIVGQAEDGNGNCSLQFWTESGNSIGERLRIDSAGRVMIGNTSAASMFGVANNLVVGSGSGSEGMTIYSDSTNDGYIVFADGASDPAYRMGQIIYSHNVNKMQFRTNGNTNRLVIDSAGFVGINEEDPQTTLNVKGTISTGRNVARELGTVISSSGNHPGRPATNVINGNKNYEGGGDWLAPGNQRVNAWLIIDLGSSINVGRAVIYNQNEYADSRREVKNFTLEGSNDNSSWTTVLDDDMGISNAHEPNPGWSFRIPGSFADDNEGVSYRYWRYTMKSFHFSDSYGGITEIELYQSVNSVTEEITTGSLVAGDVYAETGTFNRITAKGATSGLVVSSDGHVTKPSSCAFNVTPNGNQSLSNGDTITSWTTTNSRGFENTQTGGYFSSGIFTAPVTGAYFFTSTLLLSGVAGTNAIHLYWQKNGSGAHTYWETRFNENTTGYGNYEPVSGQCTMYMTAGDTCRIKISFSGSGCSLYGTDPNWGNWGGFLIG
jgi:hypothetical protein